MATRVLILEEDNIDKTYKFGEAIGINTGIFDKQLQNQADLSFYPNPVTNGVLNVKAQGFNENTIIKLFDMQGKEVFMNTIQNQSIYSIDVNYLDNGLYILSISDGKKSLYGKVLIEY